jgi:hypothetical protein
VLVVLTDGNDTASRMPPDRAADIASQKGIKIHTVAIGDPQATDRCLRPRRQCRKVFRSGQRVGEARQVSGSGCRLSGGVEAQAGLHRRQSQPRSGAETDPAKVAKILICGRSPVVAFMLPW